MEFADVAYRYPVQFQTIQNIRVAYIDQGPPQAPTLVFLHGNGADLSTFDWVYPAFCSGYRVIGIDLPGYGKSDKPLLDYTPTWYVEFLHDWIKELNVRRWIGVGHSYGGCLIMEYSLQFPEEVQALILLDAAGTYAYSQMEVEFIRANFTPEKLMAATPEQIRLSMQQGLGEWSPAYESWLEKWVGLTRARDYAGYAHAVYQALEACIRSDLLERVEGIRQPVQLIWGEKDAIIPLSAGQALAERLPQAELEVLKGCGHFPQLTRASSVVAIMNRFLKSVLAHPGG
ncbi:MAG: alpha/beta hydrolase [Calditrichaeota bacterium]|nr:alpha/beta hydrolase [Calditrichota bacterium]